jgi:hypothetical protein
MCFGGGGGTQATIRQPDYNAYDKQFALQKAAIESAMQSNMQEMQGGLDEALREQTQVLEQLSDQAREKAENAQLIQSQVNARAMRLQSLVGTPPPEKTAQAPLVGGRARGLKSRKGKSSLRIARGTSPVKNKAGSGLNLTIAAS